jgi:hypothetical protein
MRRAVRIALGQAVSRCAVVISISYSATGERRKVKNSVVLTELDN